MAADPRQFTEHNEVGGVNVYLEDKRMSELKSATGKTASQISTADEYIPLQDTDGNLVKINPASFQEAVRNVLGSLLANNDKGTTISGIPALSGNGDSLDFGSVTPANLASVLGVKVLYVNITSTPRILCPARNGSLIIINYGWDNKWNILSYNNNKLCYRVNELTQANISVENSNIVVSTGSSYNYACAIATFCPVE